MLELFTTVFTALIGVIGTLGAICLKHKLDKRKKPDMVKEALALSEIITNKIEEIREGTKADRVWITQFHNGGHFYLLTLFGKINRILKRFLLYLNFPEEIPNEQSATP